eukprot:CAMPEP_0185621496 /NCGR_PEP_ID=MMETSP0436-20130131/57589_1 /TAXON_ID=626734 ORGANISM="Favella taraikaensis, Strain Fe Narragansett Bay" /NCGR_SAMPLE_ID=MMETSP0436 /ASSEMBLY_ACC=CAM_ASM_000390 /LENGTH=69 /DNA_ID=CAMNT_0028262847 /DNA_START=127 /DNA_END=335 /DNA_ORIENTATION=-
MALLYSSEDLTDAHRARSDDSWEDFIVADVDASEGARAAKSYREKQDWEGPRILMTQSVEQRDQPTNGS